MRNVFYATRLSFGINILKKSSGYDSRLKVGVVGVGYLGRQHARIYATMPEVELIGVVDTDAGVARSVADQYGCQAWSDVDSLVEHAQAVSIAVPTSRHAQVTHPFIQAGVHVLLEKPIAATLAEAELLVARAEKSNTVLQIGHLERFNPGIMALAECVNQPRFIEAHRLGVFADRSTDVDVVTDLMIHDIDIVMSLVRSGIRNISADGIRVITDHIDIANTRIEFENGAVANVTASRVSNKRLRRIRVFGNDCYYGLDYINQTLEMVQAVPDGNGTGWPSIVTKEVEVIPHPQLEAEIAHFVSAVRNSRPPLVDGHAGLEALRVALQVREKILS